MIPQQLQSSDLNSGVSHRVHPKFKRMKPCGYFRQTHLAQNPRTSAFQTFFSQATANQKNNEQRNRIQGQRRETGKLFMFSLTTIAKLQSSDSVHFNSLLLKYFPNPNNSCFKQRPRIKTRISNWTWSFNIFISFLSVSGVVIVMNRICTLKFRATGTCVSLSLLCDRFACPGCRVGIMTQHHSMLCVGWHSGVCAHWSRVSVG